MTFGFIAPAGTPLSLFEIAAGLFAGARSSSALENLHAQMTRLSGTDACWSFSSGRAAMVVALRAMRSVAGPARTKVIIPGYTCYSVAAALERTGLTPLLCDIDPQTLSLDLEQLERFDYSDVLAIITANLYGLPNDTPAIERIARAKGVFLLDDAAQALGASVQGRPCGGFGDVGLYSFDKGKNIPTMQGGVLVARRSSLARAIQSEWERLPAAAARDTALSSVKLVPYSLLLRPILYGLVRSLPGLGLGQTPYELDYPITHYSSSLAGLASRLADRVTSINAQRVENARRLASELQHVATVQPVKPVRGADPVFLRFPILAASARARAEIIRRLERAGVGATASYPCALRDVPQVRARVPAGSGLTPQASDVASRIITLPTHAYSPAHLAVSVRTLLAEVRS